MRAKGFKRAEKDINKEPPDIGAVNVALCDSTACFEVAQGGGGEGGVGLEVRKLMST